MAANNWKPMTFLCTQDSARAKKFFGEALKMPLLSEDDFAVVFDNHGVVLRVSPVQELTPAKYTVLGWEVADIEQAVRELETAGVEMNRYFPQQDEHGIWNAPGGARVAWFNDPDGNVLSVSQH